MMSVLQFATLSFITLFAAAAAVAFNWLLLRTMFVLMRPATARRAPAKLQLVPGTAQLARAYATRR
ncbi:MAG TPA: hypothetical protein VE077_02390 [Candidatus Methylomirabilis sp.]|nr:hypothetical protein [Candidatus Methylomirabilis sp.]